MGEGAAARAVECARQGGEGIYGGGCVMAWHPGAFRYLVDTHTHTRLGH